MQNLTEYYKCYKGIFYTFVPASDTMPDRWKLATSRDNLGTLAYFNADYLRLDQCFEQFKQILKEQ